MTVPSSRYRPPDAEEMAAAAKVVRDELAPTPLVPTVVPTPLGRAPAWLKLESLQPTGAFKVRGALAALRTLGPDDRAVSASAGNHALGMAWASGRTGVPVTVVTSENASSAKVSAIEALIESDARAATLVQHGVGYDQAESYARGLASTDPAATYVSPYSDYAVMAGAATVGAEIGAELPDLRLTVAAPLGGGGLCSGLALWAAQHGNAEVAAVETVESQAVSTAMAAGRIVPVSVGDTLADGLAGNLEPGAPTPELLAAAVAAGRASTHEVQEDDLKAAIRWLFRAHGLVAEGAGAAALAAVLTGRVRARTGEGLVVVVSGRNIDPAVYAALLADPA